MTEKPILVHNNSTVELNANICLSFVYVTYETSTDNLKIIDKLIVSPDTWALPVVRLQNPEDSCLKQRLTMCYQ